MDPAYRYSLGRSRSEEDKKVFNDYNYTDYQDYQRPFELFSLYDSSNKKKPQRSNSVCIQSDKQQRKSRNSQRRSSMQTSKSKINYYSRPTPLGI